MDRLRATRLDLTRQSAVALAAGSILALHIADDAFLQPEPGTSALDHLPGGLVQLGALGLAAVAYRRGRAGVRATIAIVVGLLALVIGAASAGYETMTVGPSGDDFTGLLVLPAGLALIGVGIATLWQSRKLNDRRALALHPQGVDRRRRNSRGVRDDRPARIQLHHHPRHAADRARGQPRRRARERLVQDERRPRASRLVRALEERRRGDRLPGRSGSQAHARMLASHGYGVLLFDRRGEGKSEGDSNLLGWGADKDILAAIEFLKARPDVDPGRIGGIGLSVGGELMLQAAAETDELAAVVSEGAGTRQFSEQLEEFHGWERVLNAPGFLLVTAGTAVFSSTAPPPNLTDVAPKIKQPLFVIWAPNGGNIEHMSKEYYRLASSSSKQIWAMPTAKHVGGIRDQPKEYERRVVGFFDDTLLAG